ncbi:MAG: S9 family peptidase [Bryobacterales bacterium]|nr:S9 family peptidase [Bryobacterales bacterium]
MKLRHAAALLLAASLHAQNGKPTIEQLMSAPFPTSPAASPSGGHFAWVQNANGVRNLFLAAAPDYEAKAITPYTKDDGQDLSELVFTPEGDIIVFVRGGSANSRGEIPNPTSDAAGAEQALFIVPIAGGEPRRIGEGAHPAISPKGGTVAYTWKGQVWTAGLSGEPKPAQLFKARGTANSLAWSPDGSKLAFVSRRGTHSFIGVYDLAAKSIRWMDPSLDEDEDPVWSPDSTRIAFRRTPYTKAFTLFGPKREAPPWSIRVATVASGASKQVFLAEPGRGSVYHPTVADRQVLWAEGDILVFPWERDGWNHLYSVPAAGGSPKRLTYGSCEVEYVAQGADRKEVLFNSNCDDIDRRHIYRVPAAGGPLTPVTTGRGIEWAPLVSSDNKALLFFRSDAKTPARAALLVSFGQPRDLTPLSFPSETLVEPQAVTLTAADGMRIPAQLFLPPLAQGQKAPAVVFFHGGSRRQMLLGFHYGSYYHNAYSFNQWLVSQGYVVLSVNYRSGTGYGMEFREALSYGATGASEFQDVIGAGLFLQSRPEVDAARIGLWGGSYGGYLTALGLARASNLFAAGVDIHGVHDWNVELKHWNPAYETEQQQGEAKIAYESSPMAYMKSWKSPVLLVHGDDDRNVPFIESVMITEALRKQGVEFEQLVYPDEVHGFLRHESWLRTFRAASDFFERRLLRRRTN